MDHINCLLCGQDNYSVVLEEKLDNAGNSYNYLTENTCYYRIVKCRNCGMVYSNPIFSEKDILSFYSNASIDKYFDRTSESIEKNMRRYLNNLIRYSGIKKGHLLDVGCGAGYLLKNAQSDGFIVCGVEPNIKAADYSREIIGCDTVKAGKYTKELYPPETFDLITIIHVIDHVVSPITLLQTAQYHLKSGGYMLIATHNIRSLLSLFTGKQFIAYHVQHIGYFTPKSLSKMISRSNLMPIKTLGSITTYPLIHYVENGIRNIRLRENIIRCLKAFKLDKTIISLPMGNIEVICKKS